jgi:hypothetical protein
MIDPEPNRYMIARNERIAITLKMDCMLFSPEDYSEDICNKRAD